jgi:uncharacterized membrane protein HdeD (DUF308 family)
MSDEPALVSDLRSIARAWWVLALLGLISIVAGVIVLARPSTSLAALAVITGVFLLVDGIFELTWALLDSQQNRGLVAVFGVITAIAGVILIRHPTHAVVAIALLLGLWLIAAGVLRLFRVFAEPGRGVWSALLAVLELIAGIVIVSSPNIGVSTLALLIGLSLVIRGVGACLAAWMFRSQAHTEDVAHPGAAVPTYRR